MSKTLLLADDSVTIQKVVGISFASEDIEITTVDNGADAVAKARELRPDVILADVVMPGMSGYEVCEAVKSDPSLAHVPVVLLTGTFEAFDEERATAAGASGHVAKPFEAQTLVDRVMELLADPGAAAAAAPRAQVADLDFESSEDLAETAPESGFDLEESGEAFAFGDDDLAPQAQEPLPAPPLAPGAAAPPPLELVPEPEPAAGPSANWDAVEGAGEDAFEFSLDEPVPAAGQAPVGDDDLAQTTLLDPGATAGFDVSASEVEAPWPAEAGGDPEPAALEPTAADALLEPDPMEPTAADALLEPDPMEEPPWAVAEPLAEVEPVADEPPRPYGADVDPEAPPSPRSEAADLWPAEDGSDPAPAAAPMPPAAAAPPAGADPLDPEPPTAPGELGDTPVPAPGATDDAGPTLSPAMREEIHQMLERIAWDALGPVTEKIVQDALERIERIAWEVVPKLAETLIEEEIRRLKGGPSSR